MNASRRLGTLALLTLALSSPLACVGADESEGDPEMIEMDDQAVAENLLVNGGFEKNLSSGSEFGGWGTYVHAHDRQKSGSAFRGDHVIVLVSDPEHHFVWPIQCVHTKPGKKFKAWGHVRTIYGKTQPHSYFDLSFDGPKFSQPVHHSPPIVGATHWTRMETHGTAPQGTTSVCVSMLNQFDAPTTDEWDAINLVEIQ